MSTRRTFLQSIFTTTAIAIVPKKILKAEIVAPATKRKITIRFKKINMPNSIDYVCWMQCSCGMRSKPFVAPGDYPNNYAVGEDVAPVFPGWREKPDPYQDFSSHVCKL